MALKQTTDEAHRHAVRVAARAEAGAKVSRAVVLLVLLVGAIAFLAPFYVCLCMALKTASEVATTQMWDWPKHPTLDNFRTLFTNPVLSFLLLTKNTIFITTISTVGVVLSSALVAYGFARLDFAGRDRLFIVCISTMMLPGIVTMIPSYVMFAKIHWVDTFLPLTVPAFFGGGAFNIFLLRQFYLGIPRELDEAAFLDGASHWRIFSRIILPLSGPALATVGIFTFTGVWRDFMGPLLYLNDPSKQTLEVGLQSYNAVNGEQWHLLMAGSVIVSIPLILLFFIGQRWFVRSLIMTGGK
jgi:ABC-type glycerol-3-phosphate transport system permease component